MTTSQHREGSERRILNALRLTLVGTRRGLDANHDANVGDRGWTSRAGHARVNHDMVLLRPP